MPFPIRTLARVLSLVPLLALLVVPSGSSQAADGLPDVPIDHVILISLENHSFDNLYGTFPGADGLANAGAAATQLDPEGQPYATLPPVRDSVISAYALDKRFPTLPNGPFDLGPYTPLDARTGDLVHRFYYEQRQIDGGLMDKFVAFSDAGGLTMGHYDGESLPLWSYAKDYVLADHFFHAAFGGSMLNHFWLVCACTPTFPNAPAQLVERIGPDREVLHDGAVTPDGYAINNLESINSPHAPNTPSDELLPLQTAPHIGDRLEEAGVSWAWYAGGWNDALAGHPSGWYTSVTEPFSYFADLADGTAARAEHLKDEADFLKDLSQGTLPNVVFLKPLGPGTTSTPAKGAS